MSHKNIRVELTVTATVYVGEDVIESVQPDRAPDCVETTTVSRTTFCGAMVAPSAAAAGNFVNLMASAGPGMAERIRHALRGKDGQ